MNFKQLSSFFKEDIWRAKKEDVGTLKYIIYNIIKKTKLSISIFIAKGEFASVSALTYSTLLAFVPILAVVFSIARGFGYSKYIQIWFESVLSSQPDTAKVIVGFVNSYLEHTHSGVFLGIGLLFMLWTVFMLIGNIEARFNEIWEVKENRGISKTFTSYLALIILIPIIIVVTSGVSIFFVAIANKAQEFMLLGHVSRFFIDVLPYVLMVIIYISLYVFMPNTKVKIKNAIVPGLLSGVAMQALQFVYINSQVFLSSYNAIYGSFAALPLFMLWLQFSWSICLFGAELCYVNQNMEQLLSRTYYGSSHRYQLVLSAVLMSKICSRFLHGEKPLTAEELNVETSIPVASIRSLLDKLCKVNMLILSDDINDNRSVPIYMPAEDLSHLTVGEMIHRLESYGEWNIEWEDINLVHPSIWKKCIEYRKDYINRLNEIPLVDLANK